MLVKEPAMILPLLAWLLFRLVHPQVGMVDCISALSSLKKLLLILMLSVPIVYISTTPQYARLVMRIFSLDNLYAQLLSQSVAHLHYLTHTLFGLNLNIDYQLDVPNTFNMNTGSVSYTHLYTADRGARAVAGNSIWPNVQDKKRVPDNASLVGEHVISGDGVPEGMKFGVDSSYDFMPKIEAKATGETTGSVNVAWNNVTNAKAYFLNAMGSKGKGDMIIWSASEKPEPGWGLMNYLTPKMIEKLLKEKLILPNSQQSCAIPEGIFKETQGVMAQMIAYGPELNVVYPVPDTKKKIKPEWASRFRIKSTTMVMLGGMGANSGDNQGQDSGSAGGRNYTAGKAGGSSTDKPSGTGSSVLDKAKKLKDVFGF